MENNEIIFNLICGCKELRKFFMKLSRAARERIKKDVSKTWNRKEKTASPLNVAGINKCERVVGTRTK